MGEGWGGGGEGEWEGEEVGEVRGWGVRGHYSVVGDKTSLTSPLLHRTVTAYKS